MKRWAQQQQRWSRILHPISSARRTSQNIPILIFASHTPTFSNNHYRQFATTSIGDVSSGNYSTTAKVKVVDHNKQQQADSPVLQLAASEGRTAMEKLRTSQSTLQNLEEFHRQNLKEATEQLISATKSVDLLAKSIQELKERQNSQQNDAAKLCLQELHKAFLSLTQSLLNCLDPETNTTQQSTIVAATTTPSKNTPSNDPRILDLLLALTYRSQQLFLHFHYPLYQRLAVVLAKQPQVLTLQSRPEWIWNIYHWSQTAWGQDSTNQASDDMDLDWFRPSLLALAEQGHWSDLGYLLRNMLQPSFVTVRVPSRGRRKKKRNRKHEHVSLTILEQQANEEEKSNTRILDEDVVRGLLRTIERHRVFPSLWKNLSRPSVEEQDILEVLLLLEGSIWKIFEYDTDAAKRAASLHKSNRKSSETSAATNEPPKASLRDAIEVLLQKPPEPRESYYSWRSMVKLDEEEDNEERDDPHNDSEDIALDEMMLDLSDLLDSVAELDDESDEASSSAEVIALAAQMLDRSRVSRDLEVLARRTGNNHVLEVSGTSNSGASQSELSDIADSDVDVKAWDDEDEYEANEMIYQRVPDYRDDIPDVMSQIFAHNGKRAMKYSLEFEDEIYDLFRQPSSMSYFDDELEE